MTEECLMVLEMTEEHMEASIEHLERELHKIRAGKANPQMLDGVQVDNYGMMSPLNQVSSLSTPDPRTIMIQPWDKNMLPIIEKAIMAANLGFNPQNDGQQIRITVPVLTEERRRDLVKICKNEAEHAKISIRNSRRQANEEGKTLEKDGTPEDMIKRMADKVQDLTNDFSKKVEDIVDEKEKEIMTV